MRHAVRHDILVAMDTRLRITIDLVLTQPVGGSISSDGSQPASFDGWLELHAALEALCEAARDRHPGATDRPGR